MNRFAALAILAPVLSSTLFGQSLDQYLALRKKHGISQAVGSAALDSFVGKRVMEVKGVVRGSLGIKGKTVLLVERPDGGDLEIEAANPPEWLTNSEVHARLLVNASRESELTPFRAQLIGAAIEHSVARVESTEAARRPKASVAAAKYTPPATKSAAVKWNLPASEATPIYADFIRKYNKKIAADTAWQIAEGIIGFSIKHGVDARLIMAIVLVESSFNPNDTSHVGAMGLGQLMPGTAREMGVSNAYDTMQNLSGTVRLVRKHLDTYRGKGKDDFEALILSLAAYNAGPGAVSRHGGVPPYRETQNYVRKVVATYNSFLGK